MTSERGASERDRFGPLQGARPAPHTDSAPVSAKEDGAFSNSDFPHRRTSPGAALALIGFVGLCLLVGAVDGIVTRGSVGTWYVSLVHPPLTPPNAVFGPVWTALYVMIGVAGWLVWRAGATRPARPALRLWGWQLLLNALWTPAFFGLHNPALGLVVLLPLLLLIALTIRAFARLRPVAAWLMAPYLAWSCFATWLNFGVWWLNR